MIQKEYSTADDNALEQLINTLKAELPEGELLHVPLQRLDQERLLRALMNVRPAKELPPDVLAVQDAYLKRHVQEKGVVPVSSIPTCRAEMALWQGDITQLACDAIVNAANAQMLGCFIPLHTCIDNTIHTYAGMQLRIACDKQMTQLKEKHGAHYEQPTAVPLLTDAYNLPAKKVIHIVGPIVSEDLTPKNETQLAACYERVLDMCQMHGLKSVAFCCISTGVFRFPKQRAAAIAVATVEQWLQTHPAVMDRVVFNVYEDEDREYYEKLLC